MMFITTSELDETLNDPMAVKNLLVIAELCLNDHSVDQIIAKNPHFTDIFTKFFPTFYQNSLKIRKKELKFTLLDAICTFKIIESTGKITPSQRKKAFKYIKLLAKIY